MIKVKNISKTFSIAIRKQEGRGKTRDIFLRDYIKKEAVRDINFNINKGELVGYIGLNGAGKSTTIKILCGILHPDEGQVKVNNIDPFKYRQEHNMNIGVVFGQRGQLWRDLPVEDSFILLKKIYRVSDKDYKERYDLIDSKLQISELMSFPVRKLSLGQRMRCEFAASLIHWPEILFLDEPTIGLDIITKKSIINLIGYLNKEHNKTIILTTHNMQDIEILCERVILIDKGEIIFDGKTQSLKNIHSKHKSIILDFESLSEKETIAIESSLPEFTEVIKSNNSQMEIITSRTDINYIKDIISNIEGISTILDYEVSSIKFENIIEKIYIRDSEVKI